MIQTTYTQSTAATANSFSNATQESSELPLSAPDPPAFHTPAHALPPPPPPPPAVSPTGRQLTSVVWKHFIRLPDYNTSRRGTCMHCARVLKACRGSTSSMLVHLKVHHADKLTSPANAEPTDR
jgi:BED zinc finger